MAKDKNNQIHHHWLKWPLPRATRRPRKRTTAEIPDPRRAKWLKPRDVIAILLPRLYRSRNIYWLLADSVMLNSPWFTMGRGEKSYLQLLLLRKNEFWLVNVFFSFIDYCTSKVIQYLLPRTGVKTFQEEETLTNIERPHSPTHFSWNVRLKSLLKYEEVPILKDESLPF